MATRSPLAEEPGRAGRADAAGAAGDEDDPGARLVVGRVGRGHRPSPGTRSQSSGWPSWTRSPATDSQRTTWPANGVRTSATPTRPTRSPTPTATERVAVAGARQETGARCGQRRLRGEDARRRADDDPLGHVEVLALVRVRLGPPRVRPGAGDRVHQRVEVVRFRDRERGQLRHDAAGQPGEDAAGTELDERRRAEAVQRLERLAPADRAAELGGQQARPLRRVVVDAGVDVGDDRDLRREEDRVAERLAQGGPGRGHQRRMERARRPGWP